MLLLPFSLALAWAVQSWAAEHPEHPRKKVETTATVAPDASGSDAAAGGTTGATGGATGVDLGGMGSMGGSSGGSSLSPGMAQPDADAGGVWRGSRRAATPEPQEAPQLPLVTTPPSSEGAHSESAPPAPMTLSDARVNFPTMIESFIASRSPKGYWSFKDPETGKTLKLKLSQVDKGSIAPSAKGSFRGKVTFQEGRTDRTIDLDFIVDFASDSWQVLRFSKSKAKSLPRNP